MAIDIQSDLDFGGSRRLINVPDGTLPQHPATVAQLNAGIEGLAWKDNVAVASQANVNLAAPGASVDGVALTSGDRVLVRNQTAPAENGIYIFNGAAAAMTRALDGDSAADLKQAVVTVDASTDAGLSFRQTAVTFTLGTDPVAWVSFATGAAAASTTAAGIVELATQGEVDAGTATNLAITPQTLAGSSYVRVPFFANIGDGASTSYPVTHNLNSLDVEVVVFRNSGNRDTVIVEVQRTNANTVTVVFATAPALNAFRVRVEK